MPATVQVITSISIIQPVFGSNNVVLPLFLSLGGALLAVVIASCVLFPPVVDKRRRFRVE